MIYIRESSVRRAVNKKKRRVGRDFLECLDAFVGAVIRRSLESQPRGGKKTLDRYAAITNGAGSLPAAGK